MHGSHVTACGSPVARTRVLETHADQLFQAGIIRELLAAIRATNSV
jgi:hypothetical protein